MKHAFFVFALLLAPLAALAARPTFTSEEAAGWSVNYAKARTARFVNELREGASMSTVLHGLEEASAKGKERDAWQRELRARKLSPLEQVKALKVEETKTGWNLTLPGLQRVKIGFDQLWRQRVGVNGQEIALEGLSVRELHARVMQAMTTKKTAWSGAWDLLVPSARADDPRTKFVAASVTTFVLALAAQREKENDQSKKLSAVDMLERFRGICREEIQKGASFAESSTRLFVQSFTSETQFPLLKVLKEAPSCELAVEILPVKDAETLRTFLGSASAVCAKARELMACENEYRQKQSSARPSGGDQKGDASMNRE